MNFDPCCGRHHSDPLPFTCLVTNRFPHLLNPSRITFSREATRQYPDFAVLTPPGRTMIVFHTEDHRFDLLDVPLITRVELQEAA